MHVIENMGIISTHVSRGQEALQTRNITRKKLPTLLAQAIAFSKIQFDT